MNTRKLTTLAVLAAIAYALVYFVRIPIVTAPPLSYEPKDVIIVIAGFLFGPMSVLAVSAVVSAIEMFTVSETFLYGWLMNFVSTCAFACPAAAVYSRKRSLTGAVTGLVAGALIATSTMLMWNYIITPIYLGFPREAVVPMLLPVFLPFNLLKTGLNTGFAILLYKPIRLALSQARLTPKHSASDTERKSKLYIGVTIAAVFVIVTCILLILAWKGDI
jgi:riboflavin transporter FmnP